MSLWLDKLIISILRIVPDRLVKKILWLLQNNHELSDRYGYLVRQHHFYEPWPDFGKITREQLLIRRENSSIDWNIIEQLKLIDGLGKYQTEIEELKKIFDFYNDIFTELDLV